MVYGKAGEREKVWREWIRKQKFSGLSIAQFCRENGISQATFYNWRKKLAQQASNPFFEISWPNVTNATCEIVLPTCRGAVPSRFLGERLKNGVLTFEVDRALCRCGIGRRPW